MERVWERVLGAWRLAESDFPEAESEWNGSGKGCLALGAWQSQNFLRDMGLQTGVTLPVPPQRCARALRTGAAAAGSARLDLSEARMIAGLSASPSRPAAGLSASPWRGAGVENGAGPISVYGYDIVSVVSACS